MMICQRRYGILFNWVIDHFEQSRYNFSHLSIRREKLQLSHGIQLYGVHGLNGFHWHRLKSKYWFSSAVTFAALIWLFKNIINFIVWYLSEFCLLSTIIITKTGLTLFWNANMILERVALKILYSSAVLVTEDPAILWQQFVLFGNQITYAL